MLSSIHPFGERARNQRYGVTTSAFLVGSLLGGTALGACLFILSSLVGALGRFPGLAMLILMIAAVWDLFGTPIPSLRRQVDEDWLTRYRGWVYGAGFGLQLGFGFATYVKTPLTYGFTIAAVLAASPPMALLAGIGFGLVRGLSIFVTSSVRTPDRLRELFARLGGSRDRVRLGGASVVASLSVLGLLGLL